MPGDMQHYYKSMGYRIASDGAVEFYYVAFRTQAATGQSEICINGGFSWSNHAHDPAVTIRSFPDHDRIYRYSRAGPYPNRAGAESVAMDKAIQMFNDTTRYGIWGTGGLHEINATEYRQPSFR